MNNLNNNTSPARPKIVVLQGVPACGKTTWANEYVKNHKDTVIVSRDSIRESTGVYWVPEREGYISQVEEMQIRTAITSGLNVIIDATNLNPKTIAKWEALAAETQAEIEYKKFTISYKEALARDEARGKNGGRAVGKETIRRFFKNYFPEMLTDMCDSRPIKMENVTKTPIVLCDIDGTVALRNNRSPYDLSKVSEDSFDPRMRRLLITLGFSFRIIFLSGREGTEQCRRDTEEWLTDNFKRHDNGLGWELIMRKKGDRRNDAVIKEEIYDNEISPNYDVVCVFDDRDRVVKMWRDKGILCNQVYYGDF